MSSKDREHPKITKTGWVILGSCATVAVTVYGITTPFILPALRKYCLPYVPATKTQIDNILTLLRGRTGSLVDLGSGDGRVVIEAAKRNFRSTGIELNYWLVIYSRWASWRKETSSLTTFKKQDLWKTDLSKYNNIVIFGVDCMMEPLRDKLIEEMSTDTILVTCRFSVPGRTPLRTIEAGIDSVWLYDKRSLEMTNT